MRPGMFLNHYADLALVTKAITEQKLVEQCTLCGIHGSGTWLLNCAYGSSVKGGSADFLPLCNIDVVVAL